MKVTCHECGKRYRIDVTKIYGESRSFRCRGCGEVITVRKPEPVEEAVGQDFLTEDSTATVASPAAPVSAEEEMSFADLNDWSTGSSAAESAPDDSADFGDVARSEDATADFILSDFGETESPAAGEEVADELLEGVDAEAADEAPAAEAEPEVAEEGVEKPGLLIRFGRFWRRLTGKMIAAMLLAGLLPLILFAGISYYFTYQGLNDGARKLMQQTADGLSTQVEEWVDKNIKVLQALSTMPQIVSMDPAEQEPLLRSVAKAYPWMSLAFTLDVDGINIARSDNKRPISYAHRKYYWDIVDGKQLAWQTLIEASTGQPALILAVPIRENGELVGVLAGAMKIDDIAHWVLNWKAGKTGYAALIQKDGKVIVHPNKLLYQLQYNLVGAGNPLAVMFHNGKTGPLEYTRADGTRMFGYITGTQHGWGLMVEQEASEAFVLTERMKPIFAAVLLGALLLAILIGLIVARQITRPVLSLSDAADRLSLGELDVVINVNSKDEIGQLAKSITRMQDSLRIALEWLRSMK